MKTPCGNCPFLRKSGAVRLMRSRIEQIAGVMLDPHGGTFTCHKTTVEVEDEDGNCDREDGPNATHCAGALIFAEKNGNQTQMMRIAGRIGIYDPGQLNMDADVFDDIGEMLSTALDGRRRRPPAKALAARSRA